MTETEGSGAARRAAILEAATGVFLRYGFKKTSMDDLARAAGLSRQGLYLHFPTKDALFKEALLRVLTATRAAARAALEGEDAEVEDRILTAFEAMHGEAIGQMGAEHMNELFEAAAEVLGPALDELEQEVVAAVARVLRTTGVAARWKDAGLSAKDLADHLMTASCGVKHRNATRGAYRDHMRTAVRLVCRGGPR
jgi:AcrR family transcriptional regulator